MWHCLPNGGLIISRSAISTDTPGRVDKNKVLHVLESSGESYDRARETLKHVSVDASGKVELEDWVEVRRYDIHRRGVAHTQYVVECKAEAKSTSCGFAIQSWQSYSCRVEHQRRAYDK